LTEVKRCAMHIGHSRCIANPFARARRAALHGQPPWDSHSSRSTAASCCRPTAARHRNARSWPCLLEQAVADNPWEAIIATAQRLGCDLIFMGSHGRSGLTRLLAGSETHKVLAGADVPVMVLRPKGKAP
jgi:hypothetical protein